MRAALAGVSTIAIALVLFGFPSVRALDDGAGSPPPGGDELSALDAVILGTVEGITEFLPISSTGHLMVTNRILDIGQTDATEDAADSFVVAIQAGAIIAVFLLYRRRVMGLVAGLVGRDPDGRRLLGALVVSFLPAVVLALALENVIKDRLFEAGPVVAAWAVGGVVILAWVHVRGDRSGQLPLEAITIRQAAIIGLVQCLALWPGVSRSLVVIMAALIVGLTLAAAVEYAFLLGLITLGAATVYELTTNGNEIVDTFGWSSVVVGFVAAFVSALIAVRWMVDYLNRHSLAVFGWYRLVAAAVTGALLATGAI